jgi:hypothetical protein
MVKRRTWIPGLRQCNHLLGDIKPLDFVSMAFQQPKKTVVASTANIQSQPASRAKPQSVLVLTNTILAEMLPQPLLSDGIVALGDFSGFHDSESRRAVVCIRLALICRW